MFFYSDFMSFDGHVVSQVVTGKQSQTKKTQVTSDIHILFGLYNSYMYHLSVCTMSENRGDSDKT
jgi:hypothetical protein